MAVLLLQKVSLVNGSTWSAIWNMAWPLTINMLALALMNLFEGWIAGRLGADAQAALGVGGQLWFLFMMMTLALAAGTTALISRFCGAGDFDSAVKAGRQALLCSLVLSMIATILGLLTCRTVLHVLGASGAIEEQGVKYLTTSLLSMVPYTVLWILNSIFRASGDSFTPMLTMMLVFGLIMVGEFVLCISPIQLGIQGIGVSWIVCSLLGIIVNFDRLKRSNLAGICEMREMIRDGLSLHWCKRFLAIGIPSCMQDLAVIGGSLGVFLVLSKTSDPIINQAAWAAGWRLEETLVLMPMFGLNLAAATIVGQNLGAHMPQRAQACGWQVTAIGASVTSIVALAMFIFAPHIAAVMCSNQSVATLCVEYLRIVCWTEPFFACWRILSGAMQGAGYTQVPMYATVFCFALLRIGLAATLSHGYHGEAVWIWLSMAVSTVLAGLIMIFYWYRGKWRLQEI